MNLSKGSQQWIRLPITVQVLERIVQYLDAIRNPERPVLQAVATMAFFGFFRLGELLPVSAKSFNGHTDLSWGDVAVNNHTNPSMVQVHLKKSKYD